MIETVVVRASEAAGEEELVRFLRKRFPSATRAVSKLNIAGMECVETRIPASGREFSELQRFILHKRKEGSLQLPIGWLVRKYWHTELERAEALSLTISKYFEPCGEECGTVYKTLCNDCNKGEQQSALRLDLRKAPKNTDFASTIAETEWIVSRRFAQVFKREKMTGADLGPVIEINSSKMSSEWFQLRITGRAGTLARQTKLGMDVFSRRGNPWRCRRGHAIVGTLLTEVHLHKRNWEGTDFAATSILFGQGQNLVRPTPLIIISGRVYRAIRSAGLRGYSCEIARLV
jgi:hypothetical protein